MGMDIHVRLAVYNADTNYYNELVLYKPGEDYYYDENGEKVVTNPHYTRVTIYDGRDYEMFDGMKDGDSSDGYGIFPWVAVQLNSLDPLFRKEIKKEMDIEGCFDFYEINLADMENYLFKHPTVVDYDAEGWETWKAGDPKPQKTNPINHLYDCICQYAYFCNNWKWEIVPMSQYKVIFYFDW